MNRTYSIKLSLKTVVLFFALGSALLLIFLTFLNGGNAPITRAAVLDFLRDPIVLGIAGALITFVIIDRWKKLEQDLAELQKSQIGTLREIREDATTIVTTQIEGTTRKAQAIESRIDALVEDHPWIADITENEFIPDAASCRIVSRTAEQLLLTKPALAYEYVFSWAKRKDDNPPLEGTAEDFIELSVFCEQDLADEYLGLLVLRAGYENASNDIVIVPYYLRRLLRSGKFDDAERIGRVLVDLLAPTFRQALRMRLSGHHQYKKVSFLAQGLASLSLLAALRGHEALAQAQFDQAYALGPYAFSSDFWLCIKVENLIALGSIDEAKQILIESNWRTTQDYDLLFEYARISRLLGETAFVAEIISRVTFLRGAETSTENESVFTAPAEGSKAWRRSADGMSESAIARRPPLNRRRVAEGVALRTKERRASR